MAHNETNQPPIDFWGLTSSRKSIYKRISDYRDNGTYADEWLRFFKYLLLPLACLFTLAYGAAFHYHMIERFVGHWGAFAFALGFTVFIEVAQVYGFLRFARETLFGMLWKGWSSGFLIAFCGMISIGAFYWSYYNSTQGVAYLTLYLGEKTVAREIIAPHTGDLETRATATQRLADSGISTKWNGTTTRDGQKIAKNAATAMAEIEKQRTIAMEQASREQNRKDRHRDQFIGNASNLFAFLGGKMEWFKLFIMLSMVLCEKVLWHRMNQENDKKNPNGSAPAPSYPIGFNYTARRNSAAAAGSNHAAPTIGAPIDRSTTLYHNVPQDGDAGPGIGADAVLKYAHASLRREMANLKNENGHERTVCDRMHGIIITQSREAAKRDFSPTPRVATDYYIFLRDSVFPELASRRRQYEYHEAVLSDLYKHIDEAEIESLEASRA